MHYRPWFLALLALSACLLPQELPDTGYAPLEVEERCHLQTWYFDQDGDGFGVESVSVRACTRPSAHAAQAGDCDDKDRFTYPGAPELCLDKVPNDCSRTAVQARDACLFDSGGEQLISRPNAR